MAFGGFGGFGASSSTGGFGGFGASSSGGGFGGFGASSSGGGFGGFGASSSSGGGFGGFGVSSSAGGFGGFGASSSTGGFGGFGASSSSAGGFGGFSASSSSSGGFGGFGGGFGASSSTGGFGGFGGGFGASSSTGGFGSFGGGFGAGASSSGFGGFGASSSAGGFGGFGAQSQAAPDPFATSLIAGQGDHEVLPKFYNLWKQYYEKSPQCFCMAFIYTLVSESSIAPCWEATRQQYQAERYCITEGQWEQAKRDNPDPSRLLPCPIRSVTELAKRNEIQMKQIERYEQEKKLLTNQLQEMKRVFNHQEPGSLDRKTRDIHTRVARLRSRLLEAIANLERARPARSALGRDQGALDDKLGKVEGTCNEYLQDLYELDVVLSSHNQRYQKSVSNMILPNETVSSIMGFLDHQQKGLAGLGNIIDSCKEDLEIIQGKNPPRMAPLISGQQPNPRTMSWT